MKNLQIQNYNSPYLINIRQKQSSKICQDICDIWLNEDTLQSKNKR